VDKWGAPAVNHVELVYRPGERLLARQTMELLGCATSDAGGVWVTVQVDPHRSGADSNNVCYFSEATPEQWALEVELRRSFEGPGALGDAWRSFCGRMRAEPQRSSHFGIRCATQAAFEERLEAVRHAANTPELKDRIMVAGVYYPGSLGSVSAKLAQGFIWTDVVASGALSLGQHIELQWQVAE